MTDTAQKFYLLVCRECGNGDLVMPFGSPGERGKWAGAHTRGTGHDRWFVTESDHRLSGQEVARRAGARHDGKEAVRAKASMRRGLTPYWHAGMQCPLPEHTAAQRCASA